MPASQGTVIELTDHESKFFFKVFFLHNKLLTKSTLIVHCNAFF